MLRAEHRFGAVADSLMKQGHHAHRFDDALINAFGTVVGSFVGALALS